ENVPAYCCSVARSFAAASSCPAAVLFSPAAGREVPPSSSAASVHAAFRSRFLAQAPVRATVSPASRILHTGGRTSAASPPISTGTVIRPSDPTRPAAAPAHRVSLAPPRPGHPLFSGDAQAIAARGGYTATIGDAQAVAPTDNDTADINLQTDWSLGDEEEFQHQSNLDRSQSPLMYRWSAIQEAVNKFCGCISWIENRNQSGATIEDKLSDARKLYKVEDKQKRSFMYMHCYNLLKNQPKWIERCIQLAAPKTSNKKQKINATSSPALYTPACNEGNNGDESEAADPDAATNAMWGVGQKSAAAVVGSWAALQILPTASVGDRQRLQHADGMGGGDFAVVLAPATGFWWQPRTESDQAATPTPID
ncbi:hypothetical protein E2562_015060, partial [Oryza meyeriana var. granulata]